MLKITEIRMDYEKEQIGITHAPEFSWTLESDKRNVIQESYELEIAEDAAFDKKIYESGKVKGYASAQPLTLFFAFAIFSIIIFYTIKTIGT